MLGRSGPAMAHTVLAEVLTGDGGQRWADVLAHAQVGGRAECTRFDLRCADDHVLPVLLSVSPCAGADGFDGV